MKNKIYIIVLLVSLLVLPLGVKATKYTEWGNSSSSSAGSGCAGKDSCWPFSSSGSSNALRGIRVSLYALKDGSIRKVGASYDFVNDQNAVTSLKGDSGITFIKEKNGKIDYVSGGSFTVTSGDSNFGSNLYYNNFANYFSGNTLNKTQFFEDNKALWESLLTDAGSEYYFVLEPLTLIQYLDTSKNKIWFYGTGYEHMKYLKDKGWNPGWVRIVYKNTLATSLYIDSYYSSEGKSLEPFLQVNFAGKLADLDNTAHIDYTRDDGQYIYETDYILNYTYGMNVVGAEEYILTTQNETCTNTVSNSNCGNITIIEDDREVCTLGNEKYYLNSYNDTGKIYCTNYVTTSFDDFYSTMGQTIYSGRYFPMNNLTITTNKTCYINASDLSSVKGWEGSVAENLNGNIKLVLGNRTYDLEENKKSESVVCASYSGEVCTKATLKTVHTYSLNPFVNRFINIETMKQDTNNFQTSTNIDNGGPMLTVPLNYLNGIYKYKLDLNSSLLATFKTRLIDATSQIILNNKRYNLTYTTDNTISDSNLVYSCPYTVNESTNCSTEDLEEGKCCIEGQVKDCPPVCEYECCDESGNEIPCPGWDFKIVYRPISLTDPFPGIAGNGRIPANNWNKVVTIGGKTFSASDYYIKYNRGYTDYELYREAEPLYVIKLDSDRIKAIRAYNDYKNHDYNNFDLECTNGEKCISKFLRGTAPRFSINLIESGTCKHVTANTFDSCITRKN